MAYLFKRPFYKSKMELLRWGEEILKLAMVTAIILLTVKAVYSMFT